MKKLALLLGLLFFSCFAFAQDLPDDEPNDEKARAMKVAFITERLNLTETQAQKFWPVYNEFSEERKTIRKGLREIMHANHTGNKSDADVKKDIEKMLSLRQKELDIEKKYMERFLKIISPKQLIELHRSEMQFKKKLLDNMHQKRKHHP